MYSGACLQQKLSKLTCRKFYRPHVTIVCGIQLQEESPTNKDCINVCRLTFLFVCSSFWDGGCFTANQKKVYEFRKFEQLAVLKMTYTNVIGACVGLSSSTGAGSRLKGYSNEQNKVQTLNRDTAYMHRCIILISQKVAHPQKNMFMLILSAVWLEEGQQLRRCRFRLCWAELWITAYAFEFFTDSNWSNALLTFSPGLRVNLSNVIKETFWFGLRIMTSTNNILLALWLQCIHKKNGRDPTLRFTFLE